MYFWVLTFLLVVVYISFNIAYNEARWLLNFRNDIFTSLQRTPNAKTHCMTNMILKPKEASCKLLYFS